jgi:hypothetical protein
VDDIVVEFGTARQQAVVARFISGQDVAPQVLRRAWQDTTQPNDVWDGPLVEQFYRAIRSVNASRPANRQLRLLLGEPPIEWEAVNSRADHIKWLDLRDTYPADLIYREVVAKNRRALIVYGTMHFVRHVIETNYAEPDPRVSIVLNLERRPGAPKVFTIWTNGYVGLDTIQPDAAKWTTPSLALLNGTILGAADFSTYYPWTRAARVS